MCAYRSKGRIVKELGEENLHDTQTLKMWKVGYLKFGLSDFYHSQGVSNSDFWHQHID